MRGLIGLLLAVACMQPLKATAGDELSVDARFDKTGDAMVDASDWVLMPESVRAVYARTSVPALEGGPDVMPVEGRRRTGR